MGVAQFVLQPQNQKVMVCSFNLDISASRT